MRATPLGSEEGVTLIELVISTLIVAVVVSGVLAALFAVLRGSANPMLEEQAAAVGRAYLEEIALRSYYDPQSGAGGGACPAKEASRALYDNVCDYDGLDDMGARDQNGNAIGGLSGYRVTVGVDAAGAQLNDLSGPASVLRIDVRVRNGSQVDLVLSGYRARY
jgi:MSHA pilin protein MshD